MTLWGETEAYMHRRMDLETGILIMRGTCWLDEDTCKLAYRQHAAEDETTVTRICFDCLLLEHKKNPTPHPSPIGLGHSLQLILFLDGVGVR